MLSVQSEDDLMHAADAMVEMGKNETFLDKYTSSSVTSSVANLDDIEKLEQELYPPRHLRFYYSIR